MADRRTFAKSLAAALCLAPLPAFAKSILAVQASGELPGFRIADAPPWLAARMDKNGGNWRFAPRQPDAAAPNRVEWIFEILPYAGGQVRRFFPMPGAGAMQGARRLVAAQARLYVDGQYQTVVLGQEVVSGGGGDPLLAEFIARVTQSLMNAYAAIDMTPPARRNP